MAVIPTYLFQPNSVYLAQTFSSKLFFGNLFGQRGPDNDSKNFPEKELYSTKKQGKNLHTYYIHKLKITTFLYLLFAFPQL